jgi:GNAT superfamily N-acetyltransferase
LAKVIQINVKIWLKYSTSDFIPIFKEITFARIKRFYFTKTIKNQCFMPENKFTISTDKEKLAPSVIHAFLTTSYWATGISLERVEKRIANSLCFGVYADEKQIGFARVITDYDSFAYLADVFILEDYRGNGLSKQLMAFILNHPDIQGLRRWILATRDAHGLYAQYGFKALEVPSRWMELFNSNAIA